MKYTLLIILLLSLDVQAQKIVSVSRIREYTAITYDEVEKVFNFDTLSIPLKTMNPKIIFTNDQLQIIDADTISINLGGAPENFEDSVWVKTAWPEADLSGTSYYIIYCQFKDRDYDEVFLLNSVDNLGYNYKIAPLKMDVIPMASNVSIPVKKKKK